MIKHKLDVELHRLSNKETYDAIVAYFDFIATAVHDVIQQEKRCLVEGT